MFEPIAISLSPNTEKDDILLTLKLLFSFWRWKKGSMIEKLEREFADYLGAKYAVSFKSGRAAEYALWKAIGIKKGDKVLIPGFTCVVVCNSVLWAGGRPVYVDIDPDTFNLDSDDLEKNASSFSRAVLVQHTFGQPAGIDEILAIAKKHDLLVIEDCAHCLGAKFQGKSLGTWGIASFFSFGRDKVISSVFGGMAVTSDESLAKKLKKYQRKIEHPSYYWIFQQLFHPLAFAFLILPLYNFLNLGKLFLFLSQKLRLLSFPIGKEEKKAEKPKDFFQRMPNALAEIGLNQLKKIDKFNRRRDQIAKTYEKNLKNLPLELPEIKKDSVVFRSTVKTQKAQELYEFAKARGVLLGRWYANIIDPVGVDLKKIKYRKGSCPRAEKAAKKVVNLPTYPKMEKKDVFRVISLIKKFFQQKGE